MICLKFRMIEIRNVSIRMTPISYLCIRIIFKNVKDSKGVLQVHKARKDQLVGIEFLQERDGR